MKGYTIQHSIELLEKNAGNGGSGASTAADVSYNNTSSGLTADDVQEAIDEIVNDIPTIADYGRNYSATEKVVGSWVDGRDVFEKVIVTEAAYSVSNSNLTTITEVSTSNIDLLIDGTFIRIGNKAPVPCNFDASGSTLQARQCTSVNTLEFAIGSIIIMTYVKTATSTKKKK